ncbi:MAG: 2-isopropylmalate synthase [Chloroflexi bacterium]|nr:2-isopropylmalate synthase [Chloroflexota bacterium]
MSSDVSGVAGGFRSAGAKGSIRIFDTTLRDGEQAPGASLTIAEKLEVARQLVRLDVDVIEAGFPAASPGDWEAVHRIAQETRGVAVAGLARCKDGDPQRAVEALRVAERPHLHVFISTSEIHLQHQIRMSREEALAEAVKWVRYGRQELGRDAELEFSAMDATRSDPDYLMQVVEAVVEAGATTVNLPDTVGYAMPTEFGPLIRRAVDLVGRDAVISVHCHDDLGFAVANTITAIQNGARQVEVTINGIGERAGNASLEEVVMALATRSAAIGGHTTGVVTEQIVPTSRLVSYLTGFTVQPNKAIVGRNAFAHESGIHQDGVLKNPLNFEIMTPQSVGLNSNRLTIGKLSGRRGLQDKLKSMGFDIQGEALDVVYRAAIALADQKKEVTDADLEAIVGQQASGNVSLPDAPVALEGWSVTSSHGGSSQGNVALRLAGEALTAEGTGNGPVDALYGAVDAAVEPTLGWHPQLVDYEIRAVSGGEDAQGQVTVRARRSSDDGASESVTGHGLSTNIIEASLEAYVHALEKLLADESVTAATPASATP